MNVSTPTQVAQSAAPLSAVREAQRSLADLNQSIHLLLSNTQRMVRSIKSHPPTQSLPLPTAATALTTGSLNGPTTEATPAATPTSTSTSTTTDPVTKETLGGNRQQYQQDLDRFKRALENVDKVATTINPSEASESEIELLRTTRDQLLKVALDKGDTVQEMIQRLASLQIALDTLVDFRDSFA
ncbi:hypothetical protein H4R33_006431 [Dimargaris cristalligena]|uniref:Uncharacterized protein n=1 Tax=Dimargaris cristalligena TaxID=215637 RepID=A0A4P9ZWS1_9FUNG|nr:hypothetical protein H4R33_006431 [Dimargaris cristalligena]RKP37312.1 hypothetical protein BJ085DRAFT_39189 [Dimargaris cristalligena]|eukprot:RKP37312.1 hypothetical protein BJ085DRAFT_39189 [Dimargaris cristalligena]